MIQPTLIRSLDLSPRRLRAIALVGVAVFLAIGAAAPFLDGSRFSGKIRQTLESTLGRQVHFEEVHFTVFSGPGFSLENVTIGEDPRFGLEPFAYVPTLQARIRLDKLLVGQIQFSSFRLIEPSLNLVKRSDETWNIVELVERLSAPRRMPLNFFPVFVVSGGRIDFKFESRKTTLYILGSDLSIYPARSGKLAVQFAGYPARTDRAGNGFAHVRGTMNWSVSSEGSGANKLDADLFLDPSNLGDLTTLVEGHDVGVHGTVSSHARIEGPLTALTIRGELRLTDVHRWDLLPASGEDWRIRYGGNADLPANELRLKTFPPPLNKTSPVVLTMSVGNFLKSPKWSIEANLDDIPVKDVLPLSSRMGLFLPPSLAVTGTLGGVIVYTGGAGLNGSLQMKDVAATLPDVPPLHTEQVTATISADQIRFDPARLETEHGVLLASGNLHLSDRKANVDLSAQDYPVQDLKEALRPWVGSPPALDNFNDGLISGKIEYRRLEETESASWSGNFRLAGATMNCPGFQTPLSQFEAKVEFDDSGLEISHLSTEIGPETLRGSYRYIVGAKRPERLHLEIGSAKLEDLESLLKPTLEAKSWLARLGVVRRTVPRWLADRNLEGEITINNFLIGDASLGNLSARFLWEGTTLEFPSLQLKLPQGLIQSRGSVNLASSSPQFKFEGSVGRFPWGGGLVDAAGKFQTGGMGDERLRNLQATGTFAGTEIALNPEDFFSNVTGVFDFSFADGWPNLHLSKIQASDDEENDWMGEAASQSDGKLIFDLEHGGKQRRVISMLTPDSAAVAQSQTGH